MLLSKLSDTRKVRLAAVATLVAVALVTYMLNGSAPVGPPYRDENLTAGPEPLMLLNQPSVRDELRLTKAQSQQIQAAVEKQIGGPRPGQKGQKGAPGQRSARMGRKHQEAFLAGVLKPQ